MLPQNAHAPTDNDATDTLLVSLYTLIPIPATAAEPEPAAEQMPHQHKRQRTASGDAEAWDGPSTDHHADRALAHPSVKSSSDSDFTTPKKGRLPRAQRSTASGEPGSRTKLSKGTSPGMWDSRQDTVLRQLFAEDGPFGGNEQEGQAVEHAFSLATGVSRTLAALK